MHQQLLTRLLIGGLLLLSTPRGVAQVNIRVGYNLGLLRPEGHHEIYRNFNADRPWLSKQLQEFRTLNGLQLGLRYRFLPALALEGTWYNQYHRQAAEGTNPATNSSFSRISSFRYSSIGLGVENFLGPISWGASINYDHLRFRSDGTGQDRLLVQENFGWSSHFFISYNLQTRGTLRLSLRPYLHRPWYRVPLVALQENLNPGSPAPTELEEDYTAFGLMLVFYNGR
ncbi:MAG: hypothetical protein AAFW73_07290 [Bacteroidota bacterium]